MGSETMARIRTIKPEFWTSEQIMECSPNARLLFIGLWNFCDDAGIHPASAKTLKAEIFPGDDIPVADVQLLIEELIQNKLIIMYLVGDKRYWIVTGWHHQRIEKPNYRHPKPEITQPLDEHSTTIRRPLDDHSPPEGKGMESTGVYRSKPLEKRGEVNGTTVEENTQAQPSRKGIVCGLLRKAGMADAAPHYLTDETWSEIFAKRTDEEIVETAKAKMAANPGRRIGLKYIVPVLLADPEKVEQTARGSPDRKKTLTEMRMETIAGLTGSNRKTQENENHGAIESTAVRITA